MPHITGFWGHFLETHVAKNRPCTYQSSKNRGLARIMWVKLKVDCSGFSHLCWQFDGNLLMGPQDRNSQLSCLQIPDPRKLCDLIIWSDFLQRYLESRNTVCCVCTLLVSVQASETDISICFKAFSWGTLDLGKPQHQVERLEAGDHVLMGNRVMNEGCL